MPLIILTLLSNSVDTMTAWPVQIVTVPSKMGLLRYPIFPRNNAPRLIWDWTRIVWAVTRTSMRRAGLGPVTPVTIRTPLALHPIFNMMTISRWKAFMLRLPVQLVTSWMPGRVLRMPS
jgi:hypothetical protein